MKAAVVFFALVLAVPCALAQDAPEPKPVEKAGELDAKIEKLVKQLGSDKYREREAATEELKKIGRPAVPALTKALKSEDLEVRVRAESILKALGRKDPRAKDGRPATADPRRGPRTSPRLGKDMEEILKELPEQQRKLVEEMLKRLEEIEKDFDRPGKLPPLPLPGEGDEDGIFPEEARKALEEMRKRSEEARKRFRDLRRRMEESDKKDPLIEPKTEPREDNAPRKRPLPPGNTRFGATIVLKKLTWKNGKLVEEKEYRYDSQLQGLFVIDRGEVLEALRYHLELGEKEGVLVDSVEKDSPFAAGGVSKHDIIIKVDGKTVGSRKTLAGLLKDKDKVVVELIRRGERKTLKVILKPEKETPGENK